MRRGIWIRNRVRTGTPTRAAAALVLRPATTAAHAVAQARNDLSEDVSRPHGCQQVAAVDLLWIPLGAGASVARASGKLFEAVSCLVRRRRRCDLYHSALEVTVPAGRFVIEMTPVPDFNGERRGVVAGGAVGANWAGRFRIFRYEIRRWRQGVIPDATEAIDSPQRVTDELACAQRILDLVPSVPTPVWGRDELLAGEMWNSNSVTSWLLARGRVDITRVEPPRGGRAPGWDAGVVAAARGPTPDATSET